MDAEIIRRLGDLYIRHSNVTLNAYKAMASTEVSESPEAQESLDRTAFQKIIIKIGQENLPFVWTNNGEELTAKFVEDQMEEIIGQIRCLIQQVHLAMPNAGETLRRVFCASVKEIRICTFELFDCSIRASPRIEDRTKGAAQKLMYALKKFLGYPSTNARAIEIALQRVANGIKNTVREMEHKAESTTGKVNSPKRNSIGIVKVMAIHVGIDAALLIEALTRSGFLIDNDAPGSVKDMEELVTKSTTMRDRINEIKDRLSPLREIPKIVEALDDIENNFVKYYKYKLQHHRNEWIEYFQASSTLDNSIQGLKTILNPLPLPQG